jgi:hypothetical protein
MPAIRPQPMAAADGDTTETAAERMGVHDPLASVKSMTPRSATVNTPRPLMKGTNTSAFSGWESKHLGASASLSALNFGTVANFDSKEAPSTAFQDRGSMYVTGE